MFDPEFRHRSILSFRSILQVTCLDPVLQGQRHESPVNYGEVLEDFFAIFTTVLQERTFLLDYNARFSIREDFEIFEQSAVLVDPTRKHYILDALCESTETSEFLNSLKGEKEKCSSDDLNGAAAAPLEPPAGAVGASRSSVQVESMISSVRDMLPYLGDGFVEKCLEHYQYKENI